VLFPYLDYSELFCSERENTDRFEMLVSILLNKYAKIEMLDHIIAFFFF
jgi:hypothetical protein